MCGLERLVLFSEQAYVAQNVCWEYERQDVRQQKERQQNELSQHERR